MSYIRIVRATTGLVLVASGSGIGAQPKIDYVTPSVQAHAGLSALATLCDNGLAPDLERKRPELKALALREGWSAGKFDTVYAAAYASTVKAFRAGTPSQRAASCTKMRDMREGKAG